MTLANLFHVLCIQHVSDINISIIRCDCAVELPHPSFCSRFVVCWRFGAAVFEWCPCCRLQCNTDTTQTQPHQISNTKRTENKTTDVVIQQHNRKFLMIDILMSEICWVHKKWNKIASDIKLVFYSSTIDTLYLIRKTLTVASVSCKYTDIFYMVIHVSWREIQSVLADDTWITIDIFYFLQLILLLSNKYVYYFRTNSFLFSHSVYWNINLGQYPCISISFSTLLKGNESKNIRRIRQQSRNQYKSGFMVT